MIVFIYSKADLWRLFPTFFIDHMPRTEMLNKTIGIMKNVIFVCSLMVFRPSSINMVPGKIEYIRGHDDV